MLDFEKYKYKEICCEPDCPSKPRMRKYSDDSDALRRYAEELKQWRIKREEWDNYWIKINNENIRLQINFKQDLINDLGIQNHPKADKLFELAWDYGNASSGNYYEQVYKYALQLVQLIKD